MTPKYEDAISKYYQSLKICQTPLISWDIFSMQFLDEKMFNSIQNSWAVREDFHQIVNHDKRVIIITDKHFKIIYASSNMTEMNGYVPYEVLNQSPKLFQGKLTSQETTLRISEAIQELKPFKEVVLNYRKDGSVYNCEIEACPKFSKKGEFLNYVAIEKIAS